MLIVISTHYSPVKDFVVVNDRWGTRDACKNGGFFTCRDHYNPGEHIWIVVHSFSLM